MIKSCGMGCYCVVLYLSLFGICEHSLLLILTTKRQGSTQRV